MKKRVVNYKGVCYHIRERFSDGTTKYTHRYKKTAMREYINQSRAVEWTLRVVYNSRHDNSATESTKVGILRWLNAFSEPDLLNYLTKKGNYA